MSRIKLHVAGATVAILVMYGTVMAGTIYRWTDTDGQPHFSDTPPPGHSTVLHESITRRETTRRRPGLRHGERRILGLLEQEAERKRQSRKSNSQRNDQRRLELQRSCGEMRKRLRDSRDHTLRKHYASELRKHCW